MEFMENVEECRRNMKNLKITYTKKNIRTTPKILNF